MAQNEISVIALLQDKLSGPLSTIRKEFDRLETGINKVQASLAPLTNRFTKLAASVLSVQTARQALAIAEEQTKAEQSVLVAFEGQVTAREELYDITARISGETGLAQSSLLALAATLKQMGVSAKLVPEALQASVDTSAALGKSLEEISKSVATSLTIGRAGELAEKVRELKDLETQGFLTGNVLDVLREKYAGAAKELAETDFGERDKILQLIGDQFIRVGKVLITILNPALLALEEVSKRIADVVTSPGFEAVLKGVRAVTPFIIKIVAAASAIVIGLTAIKAASFVIGTIATLLSGILSIVFAIVTAFGGIPAILVTIVTLLGGGSKIIDSIKKSFDRLSGSAKGLAPTLAQAFAQVAKGEKDITTLWELVVRILKSFAGLFDAYIIRPISLSFRGIVDLIEGIFKIFRYQSEASFDRLRKIGADIKKAAINGIIEILELIPQAGKEALTQFAGINIDETIASLSLESNLDSNALATSIAKATTEATKGAELIKNAFSGISDTIATGIAQAEATLKNSVANIYAFANEEDQNFLRNRIVTERQTQIEQRKRIISLQSEVENLSKSLSSDLLSGEDIFSKVSVESVRSLFARFDATTISNLQSVLKERIAKQLEERRITVAEFLKLQREIETNLTTKSITSNTEIIETRKEELALLQQELVASTKATDNAELQLNTRLSIATSYEEAYSLVTEFTKAQAKEQEKAFEVKSLQDEILRVYRLQNIAVSERLNLEEGLTKAAVSIGQTYLTQAETARQVLVERRKELSAQLDLGLPFAQALEADRRAVQVFSNQIELLTQQLKAIQEAEPGASVAIDRLLLQIAKIQSSVATGGLSNVQLNFFEAVKKGAIETTAELSNLENQGVKIGQTLVDSFGNGLVDALFDANTSWKQFANSFITLIAKMIAKLALFNLLKQGIGAFGGFGGSGAGADPSAASFIPGFLNNEGGPIQRLAKGGKANKVQGLLTPGERVVPANIAKRIGISFLTKLNSVKSKTVLSRLDSATTKIGNGVSNFIPQVPGPAINQDIVPATLTPGDYVLNRATSKGLSSRFFQWLSTVGTSTVSSLTRNPTFNKVAKSLGVVYRNAGGIVNGPSVNQDIVEANLTPGEYVVNKATTSILSPSFFRFLETITSTRDLLKLGDLSNIVHSHSGNIASIARVNFATGGSVASPTRNGNSNSKSVLPVVSASYQEMDRLLAGGGENAIFDLLGRNPDVLRGIIGI